MAERYRDYVVRKYVRARCASEAIQLEKDLPVCEVNEMAEKSAVQNPKTLEPCIGFQTVPIDEGY